MPYPFYQLKEGRIGWKGASRRRRRESKGAQGLTVGPYRSTYSRILQFPRDQASDSGEVVTPFMQDGTYPTRNFATLGPFLTYSRRYASAFLSFALARRMSSSQILALLLIGCSPWRLRFLFLTPAFHWFQALHTSLSTSFHAWRWRGKLSSLQRRGNW